MEIYLTHSTALEYWRRQGKTRGEGLRYQRRARIPAASPSAQLLEHAGDAGFAPPLEIVVATPDARRPSSAVKPYVFSGSLPDNSFVSLGDGLFVSSPELCFFQMASKLSLIELIELGFELCGSFALLAPTADPAADPAADPEGDGSAPDDKGVYDLPELTSVKKLAAFVERMKGADGYARASKALRYIADGSGSPMEARLTMLLTLPYRYGGYGLPMPQLNYRITPDKVARRSTNRSYFECDLYWPAQKLAVEYDSEKHHSADRKIAEDAIRRNTLSVLGITPIVVTKRQLFSVLELEKLAVQLSRKLGKQLKHKKPGFDKARDSLRKLLL